jgi:hypothetical protein
LLDEQIKADSPNELQKARRNSQPIRSAVLGLLCYMQRSCGLPAERSRSHHQHPDHDCDLAEKDRLRDIADDIGVLRRQEIRETDRDVGETVRDEPSYKFPCTSSWPPIEQLHCSPPGLWLFPFGILVYKAQVFPRVFGM